MIKTKVKIRSDEEKEEGEIVAINRYFDDVNCVWKSQGTITIDFKKEANLKLGKCKVTQGRTQGGD